MRYRKVLEAGKSWTFVATATADDSPEKTIVVLRPDDGTDIYVESASFLTDYMLDDARQEQSNDAIKESLNCIRQISTIRFVALPFFIGAFGALVKAAEDEHLLQKMYLCEFALMLAVVGAVFEIVLSRNLICWWKAIGESVTRKPAWWMLLAHRNPVAVWSARIALFIPYVVMIWFWVSEISNREIACLVSSCFSVLAFVAWVKAKPWQMSP